MRSASAMLVLTVALALGITAPPVSVRAQTSPNTPTAKKRAPFKLTLGELAKTLKPLELGMYHDPKVRGAAGVGLKLLVEAKTSRDIEVFAYYYNDNDEHIFTTPAVIRLAEDGLDQPGVKSINAGVRYNIYMRTPDDPSQMARVMFAAK